VPKKANIALWAFVGAAVFLLLQWHNSGPWVGSLRLVLIGYFDAAVVGAVIGAALAALVNWVRRPRT